MWREPEYDRYLRPVIDLGHCHFKGGKGGGSETSSSREIPAQTAEEKQLQDYLMDYSVTAGNMGKIALNGAGSAYGHVFQPEWKDLYNSYANGNDANMAHYTDMTEGALDDYAGAVNSYRSGMNNALGQYKGDVMGALGDYLRNENQYLGQYAGNENRYLGQYEGNQNKYLGQYEGDVGDAKAKYEAALGKRSPLWDDLVNGILPSAYANNRQAALNADLRGTMGSAVNNLANRGVINSSVANKAMDDISQSAADTLAKRYADDIQLEASLLDRDRGQAREAYDVSTGAADKLYGAQTGANNSIYGAQTGSNKNVYGAQTASNSNQFAGRAGTAGSIYDNTASGLTNIVGQQGQLASAQLSGANSWINNALSTNNADLLGATTAQEQSFAPITNYLNYTSQLYSPGENLFSTMYSGRMGTGSTVTKTSQSSDPWSAVGTLGSAFILCFTGDTLVTTPEGYKAIRDVKPGDEVLSLHEGEVVTKKVKSVTKPYKCLVVNVYWDNGTVWHVTPGQRYFDGKHFIYIGNRHIPAVVHGGEPTKLLKVEPSGKMELVYDITLEGFAGENVFFANDVAAEGFGE